MKHLNQLALILYCVLIFWLSNQPSVSIPLNLPNFDKVVHAGAYFIMGILAWRAFTTWLPKPVFLTIVFCSLYGLSDEWHQSYIVGRYADVFDWVADTVGGIFSVLLMNNSPKLKRKF